MKLKEKCPICGNNSVIRVANVGDIALFSCMTTGCENYAELLVRLGENEYVNQHTLIDTLTKIVKDGKTDIQESES